MEVTIAAERRAFVLSAEDVLVARLEEFEGTGHSDPPTRAFSCSELLISTYARLERRVTERRVEHVLRGIESLKGRADRGEQIELWDYRHLARALRHRGLP